MLKKIVFSWTSVFVNFMVLCLFLGCITACGSSSIPKHKKPKGKLQKGSRIPCPIKDC